MAASFVESIEPVATAKATNAILLQLKRSCTVLVLCLCSIRSCWTCDLLSILHMVRNVVHMVDFVETSRVSSLSD